MSNNTLWVAALTGGMAILSSWLTSRGNRQSAREQAEFAATSQRHERLREIRRASYLDLILHTQSQRKIMWKIRDATQRVEAEQRLEALQEQSRAAWQGYETFLNLARVVAVEGPSEVIDAAESLRVPLAHARRAIKDLADGNLEAMQCLELHNREAHEALTRFVAVARNALNEM